MCQPGWLGGFATDGQGPFVGPPIIGAPGDIASRASMGHQLVRFPLSTDGFADIDVGSVVDAKHPNYLCSLHVLQAVVNHHRLPWIHGKSRQDAAIDPSIRLGDTLLCRKHDYIEQIIIDPLLYSLARVDPGVAEHSMSVAGLRRTDEAEQLYIPGGAQPGPLGVDRRPKRESRAPDLRDLSAVSVSQASSILSQLRLTRLHTPRTPPVVSGTGWPCRRSGFSGTLI